MDFELILIGSDINAYYMARNFHEEYNRKCFIIAKEPLIMTSESKIVNITYYSDLLDEKTFADKLINFSKNFNNKKLLLVGCSDDYVKLIIENKEILKDYYVFNYIDKDLLDKLLVKELFYNNFNEILDLPKTYIYSMSEGFLEKTTEFIYPIIIKPSNNIEYHTLKADGLYKVFKIHNEIEFNNTIDLLKKAGYKSNLIIQEFVKGEDSNLFDCVMYVDKNHNIKLMSFAQIGLQERTPLGIGNCTVLVNGFNEFENTDEIKNKLISFVKMIKYKGFLEFDLKYDMNSKKFKIFEINPRQARSSYYLTACGYNLVKYLVDDLIYDKDNVFTFIEEEYCLSFVPLSVIKRHVKSERLKSKIIELYKKGRFVDPLNYDKDMSIKRYFWLKMRYLKYNYKYSKYKW